MTKNRKRILIIALAVLVAAVGGAIWRSRSGQSEQPSPQNSAKQPKPLLVEVATVERGDIVQRLELSGEVVAGDSVVEVHRAEVQAAEAALAVARAKLADLKAGTRPEAIDRAEANVRRWEATLTEARRSYERQKQLIADDFTSQQSVDQARERMDVAEAELAAAREALGMLKAGPTQTEIAVQESVEEEAAARLALAKAHLSENVITAPFDGVISAVHVRPGDLATPRSPLLEMYAPDSLVIRFSVPEAHSAAMRAGRRLRVTLDALVSKTFSAEVVRVYPQLDESMRTRTVEAKLTEAAPAEAVLTAPDGERYVFAVDQGKARRHVLEIGIEQDQTVQVLSGLEPGQRIVVAGQAALRDGQAVRLPGQDSPGGGQSPGGQSPGDKPSKSKASSAQAGNGQ